MPNLAANPVLLIYGIAGLAAIAMLLLGFGIYAAVTAPQARLKRRISTVVGDPLPAMVLPGTGRKDQNAGAKRKKQIQERLKHAEEARHKRRGSKLREQLVFAGLSISPQQFILYALLGGAIVTGLTFIFGLPPIMLPAVGLVAFLGIPKFVLGFLIKRRLKKFIAAFPDAIDIIVRGVRSGLTVGECLSIISQESPDPVGPEFRMVNEAIKLGQPMADALQRMSDRLPSPEFRYFTIVLGTQQTTGGNLAETLAKLSDVLRQRKKMRDKVQAMSSEAKASAGIIGSLPLFVMGALTFLAPDYVALLFTTETGNFMLAICVVVMGTGVMVMRKMINFDM
ncbi:type II secretion system F family protein [Dongia sedimenti]|uniref:Type II secretion system F family protein n=1 Tax=Dongia sedimenti TaxID=3064282 RepID=A0ABU0YRS8_9PROT|nr:type II secretion system F family protein [Rhodospirillaceae bacterium R-7]